jgi:predicted O-methyltransferase YrrM
MTAWSNGYVADIPYTHGYFRRMKPAHIRLTGLMRGHAVPNTERVAYAELGCGQGFGTTLIAAANPDADVYGFDFNPEQIHNARQLSARAGLQNVTFSEMSLEELAELPRADLPDFDIVALHGVYSWISPEARAAIGVFLRRKLKPGGLVYISYNAMPGCAALQPLQRLVRAEGARMGGTSDARARAGVTFAAELAEKGFGFLKESPAVARRLEHNKNHSGTYLAHEYLNADWTVFYLEDVVRELDAAKLVFLGSARLLDNDLRLSVPTELQEFFEAIDDPIRRETLKDYWCNRTFRVDVFQKGRMSLSRSEVLSGVRTQRVGLRKAAKSVDLAFSIGSGPMVGHREYFDPLLDRLGRGSATIAELEEALRGKADLIMLMRMIVVLDASDQLEVTRLTPADPEPSRRLNRVLAEDWTGPYRFVAAPEFGGALEASSDDLLLLNCILHGTEPTVDALAEAVAAHLVGSGGTREVDTTVLRKRATRFVDDVLPVWRMAGVVAGEGGREAALPRIVAVS